MSLSAALPRRRAVLRGACVSVVAGVALAGAVTSAASAQLPSTTDPRSSLAPGLENPGTVSKGIEHVALRPKPPAHTPPEGQVGSIPWWNSDMAF